MGKRIIKYLKHIIHYLLYIIQCLLILIYDGNESCIICNKNICDENMICFQCENKIKLCADKSCLKINKNEVKVYTLAYYSSIIKNMILRLKYKSDFKCAEVLGDYLTKFIKKENIQFDFVTFVPMSKQSLKDRGYNQSELLGKIISKNTGIPIIKCLKKDIDTKDQIGLDAKNRWENMKNCFEFNISCDIKDKKILLVDDVITTGATAFYCSSKLIENNAREIFILTVAKSKV